MGMFDNVMVPCPECGVKEEFQSKSGECRLDCYELEDAPAEVLTDINRHSPYECEECGAMFKVQLKIEATSVLDGKI